MDDNTLVINTKIDFDEGDALKKAEGLAEKMEKKLAKIKANAKPQPKVSRRRNNSFQRGINGMNSSLLLLVKRFAGLFAFTTLIGKLVSYIERILRRSAEFRQVMGEFKGAVLTLVQPLIEFVIPIVIKAIQVLTAMVKLLARLVSRVFGKSLAKMAADAQAMYDAVNGTNNSLAEFDELDVVGTEEIPALFGGVADTINAEIMKLALATAIAMIAVGLILVFTGVAILPGLALIAAGVAILYEVEKEDPGAIERFLSTELGAAVTLIAGIVLLVVGLLVLCTGNIFGLALVVAGALFIKTAYEHNPEFVEKFLGSKLVSAAELFIGTALLVVGMILLCTGNILGLGLIVLGAIAIKTAYDNNPDYVKGFLNGKLVEALTIVGGFLFIFGVILLFTGNFLIGLGLMIAGYLVFTSAANNLEDGMVKNFLDSHVTEIKTIVAGVLFILGVIMLFTGVGIAIGLGLMVAGYVIWCDREDPKWGSLISPLEKDQRELLELFSTVLFVLGVVLLFCGLIPIGLGLMVAGFAGTEWSLWDPEEHESLADFLEWQFGHAAEVAERWWNQLVGGAKRAWESIKGIYAKIFGVGEEFDPNDTMDDGLFYDFNDVSAAGGFDPDAWRRNYGASVSSGGFSLSDIGGHAKGTVVPPNKEFLARLGDNTREFEVVSPLSMMKQAFLDAAAEGGFNGSARVEGLLEELISVVSAKELTISPSPTLGRVINKSQSMYRKVTG